MRSWNGLPFALSTVMNGLSSSFAPVESSCCTTGRGGKFHDAPKLPVERETDTALDWSGLFVTGVPRLNRTHARYALPCVSHATDGSLAAWKYSRTTPPNAAPRMNPFGTVLSFQVSPPFTLHAAPQLPSPRR